MSVVVLFSGGLDSTALLYHALAEEQLHSAIWFRYAHPAAPNEQQATAEILRHLWKQGQQVRRVELSPPLFGSDAMSIGSGEAGPRVVAGRNQVMVSLGVNYAAAAGVDEVWFGASGGDQSDYPDCRPEFVEAMDSMAQAWGVRVRAPMIDWTREQVRTRARALGVPMDLVWSCYEPMPGGKPCGTCNSCKQDVA